MEVVMNKVSSTIVASPKAVSRDRHGINLGFGGGISETICLQNKSTVAYHSYVKEL